jgi:hypothetical protein
MILCAHAQFYALEFFVIDDFTFLLTSVTESEKITHRRPRKKESEGTLKERATGDVH